jgi:hypothetical protein
MIAQRPAGAAPAVLARSETLPFADRTFDSVQHSTCIIRTTYGVG